jgi:PEP-CTERM motif
MARLLHDYSSIFLRIKFIMTNARLFWILTAAAGLLLGGTAGASTLPDAVSYEYFGFNFAMNEVTSNTVGTLDYSSGPGCGGVCTATTALGSDPTVSLNADEVVYQNTGGGYAQAELYYYIQYNNAPGTYTVDLNAVDSLSTIAAGSPARAQAYLGFGPSVTLSSPPGAPAFQSYLVNETDCSNGCPTGIGNYTSPSPFPSVIPVSMTANSPYLLHMFVTIAPGFPGTTGVQLAASVDPTFSDGGQGGTFTFSPGVTSAVPEASTWMMMLIGLGGVMLRLRSRRRSPIFA